MVSEIFRRHLTNLLLKPGVYGASLKRLKVKAVKNQLIQIHSVNMNSWPVPISIEKVARKELGDTLNAFTKLVERISQESKSNDRSFISRISRHPLSRHDQTSDAEFYDFPRFCTHIDDHAINCLSDFYQDNLMENSTIVDLCSSWISHLPKDKKFHKVIGIGMNKSELDANKRLDERYVCDLNLNPQLPMLKKDSVDHVLCAVSIDYLIQPISIFHEVLRILKPSSQSTFVISFSNRCFPTKAIRSWLETDDAGRLGIVSSYFQESNDSNYGSWKNIKVYDLSKDDSDDNPSSSNYTDPLFVVMGEKC